jgi:hypothetical protein
MTGIGLLCETPDGLIVVPFFMTSPQGYNCVVVSAPEKSRYPVGGHNIYVPTDRLTPIEWMAGPSPASPC